jgi:glycosyltransferase involved in cell wall biosynthesis
LERVLNALRVQTLPLDRWELLLVDNASDTSLAETWDVTWHPRGRVGLEKTLGLTHARICGIEQSCAGLLVFVDDDNLLAPDFLSRALEIARDWPILGTWGGQCWPDFEVTPDKWSREYWTPRDSTHDRWSNLPELSIAMPSGGGMCVRRRVAEAYVALLKKDPARRMLGRAGNQLLSADDRDLSLTACDLGLGNGIFPALQLTH